MVPDRMKFINYDPKEGHKSLYVDECEVPKYDRTTRYMVKVEATGVNRIDLLQSQGKSYQAETKSKILGRECVGYLVDPITNTVTDTKVMCLLSGGGYAQYATVSKEKCLRIPKGFSFEQAAAIPEQFINAYQLLHVEAKVQPDKVALIHRGGSAVGTSLIQLAKLAGLHTIAVASSFKKLEVSQRLGAFCGINYQQIPDFAKRVQLITDGEGVDYIFDPVCGGSFFNENLQCLGMDSKWVIYGTMGGSMIKEVNMMNLISKRAQLLPSTLHGQSLELKKKLC